jgi:hypothetical protein
MNHKATLLVLMSLCLSGCMSASVTMYPVAGPYAAVVPLPVVKAIASGIEGNSGTITMTMPNGEKCKGTWSSVAPQYSAVTTGSLFSVYGGTIYGSTVSSGLLPGVNKGQAFAPCDKGTTVNAEFYTGSGTASGYGIAKDSNGNVYKMLF